MDYPYIILYLLLIALTFFYWRGHEKRIFTISVCIALLFIGLRAPVVAADTYNYVQFFKGKSSAYDIASANGSIEPLYLLYNDIMRTVLRGNGVLFLFVTSLLSLFPLFMLIKRYSYNMVLSVLLFFLINDLTDYLSMFRQVLGLSCLIIGIIYFEQNRKYKWVLLFTCGFVGVLFHYYILVNFVAVLVLLFVNIERRWVYIIAIVLSLGIGMLLESSYISYAIDSALKIYEIQEGNAGIYLSWELAENISFFHIARLSVVALISVCFMDGNKLNHIFTKLYILGIIIFNLFYPVLMIHRLVFTFLIFDIVVVTWILDINYSLRPKRKQIINVLMWLTIFYFARQQINQSIDYDLNDSGRMHPYYFFWEDYSSHPSITRF